MQTLGHFFEPLYIQGIFSKGAGASLSANLCDTCEPLRASASHLQLSASKGCHLQSLADFCMPRQHDSRSEKVKGVKYRFELSSIVFPFIFSLHSFFTAYIMYTIHSDPAVNFTSTKGTAEELYTLLCY